MQHTQNKRPPVAQIFPPDFRDALVSAGMRGDIAMIDLLTDQLASRGYCRPRTSDATPAPLNRWELGA